MSDLAMTNENQLLEFPGKNEEAISHLRLILRVTSILCMPLTNGNVGKAGRPYWKQA